MKEIILQSNNCEGYFLEGEYLSNNEDLSTKSAIGLIDKILEQIPQKQILVVKTDLDLTKIKFVKGSVSLAKMYL